MRIFHALSLCLLLLLPASVLGDVFTPPPTDKSVEWLGYIFGNRMGTIYLGGYPNQALMRMFEIFNAAIVCIGVLIVSYTGIVSTINTAQEGKTMGRKYASIWIPIRSALGMAVLVPSPASGYSVIQVTFMWLILHGIGAADHIWNGILGDLSQGLGITTTMKINDDNVRAALRQDGALLTENLLRSAVCTASFHYISNNAEELKSPATSIGVTRGKNVDLYDTKPNISASADVANITGTVYIGIKGDDKFSDICGRYTISGQVDQTEFNSNVRLSEKELTAQARNVYQTKVIALQVMFDDLYKLAVQIVQQKTKPRNDINRLSIIPDQAIQPAGYRSRAITIYEREMSRLIIPQHIDQLEDIVQQGVQSGWVSAGTYYFAMNRTYAQQYFDSIYTPPESKGVPRCDIREQCTLAVPEGTNQLNEKIRTVLEYPSEKNLIGTRLWDAGIYLETDSTSNLERLDLNIPIDGELTDAQRRQNLQIQVANDLMRAMNEKHADPIIAQGKFGAEIMSLSESLWQEPIAEARVLAQRIEEGSDENSTENRAIIQQLTERGEFFLSIYGIVWIIGATLAIYVPLIPYMMFGVGVVGWFLLVIEAIVAAPVFTLSFIIPAGEELGKIMQGLMLLFNILLRPTLMLFGFILATRLYGVVVEFVNFGMIANFSSLDTGNSRYAWVALLVVYGAFVVALANKCFALIYGLPDKILRWMGGGPEHTDASQEMHQVKGTIGKGADTVNKISTGVGERGLVQLQNRTKAITPPDAIGGGAVKRPTGEE